MSNDNLKKEIDNLERKVKLLVSEHQKLKDELAASRREIDLLKGELSVKDGELSNFQNKFKISKLVGNMVVEREDTMVLKAVLDDYITEIDKCIVHLGEA
ncbi:MAG: bZIP transcription factor [Bacteroidota bacterium]